MGISKNAAEIAFAVVVSCADLRPTIGGKPNFSDVYTTRVSC